MYQQGQLSIANGASTVTVTYPQAFAATPAVVVPVVRNISADGSKLAIAASLVTSNASGSVFQLSQSTNSANYELVWIAGDEQAVLAVFSALSGRSLGSYPSNGSLASDFRLPLLLSNPVAALKTVTPDSFWSMVVQRAGAAPSTPGEQLPAHAALSVYLDEAGGYLYMAGETRWVRLPVEKSNSWSTQPFFAPFREAEVTLSPDGSVTEFEITFGTAFESGNPPKVQFSLRIPTGVAEPTVVHAMQSGAATTSAFKLRFNAPLAHDVAVYYYARQLP